MQDSISLLNKAVKSMLFITHEGAQHCQKPLGWRQGLSISTTVGLTKTRAFA